MFALNSAISWGQRLFLIALYRPSCASFMPVNSASMERVRPSRLISFRSSSTSASVCNASSIFSQSVFSRKPLAKISVKRSRIVFTFPVFSSSASCRITHGTKRNFSWPSSASAMQARRRRCPALMRYLSPSRFTRRGCNTPTREMDCFRSLIYSTL